MNEKQLAQWIAYGVAVLATAVSLLLRLPLVPWLGYHAELMTFFPAVIVSAYLGGLGPGLVATVLGAAAGDFFFIEPRYSFAIATTGSAYGMGLFVLTGAVISGVMESMHRSRRRIATSERRYAVTLASIGDAIIATDRHARVTFVNPVAEVLTGWPLAEAVGRPLPEVFRIFHEQTHQPVEDPAAKVLRLGNVVGLANHTALLARDGRQVPIDDCGAPIVDDRGAIAGVVVVFRDASQRRRAEEAEALRLANERLELALRGSSVGVWVTEMRDGNCRNSPCHYVNVWEQLGYEEPPAGADNAAELLHPDDRVAVEEAERRHLAGETTEYEIESRFRHRDGSYRNILARGVALRDGSGKPIRFMGVTIDITERKRIEEALRASEQRWRNLTEALPQLVWSATPDGSCDYFSAQWTEHTGVSEPDLLGWRWLETLHPDDREPTRTFWLDSVAEHHPYDIEYRVRRRDGEYRWFKTRGVPIRDTSGAIMRWFGTGTDITELRQTQEELRERERQLDSLMGHVPGLAYRALADDHWTALFVNKGIEDLAGYPADEFTSRRLNYADIMLPEDRPATREAIFTALRERRMYEAEHRIRHRDGSIRWIWARGHGVFAPDGSLRFIEGLNLDMTSRKRLDAELLQAKDAAEAANRAKDEFLANVSHEIRTPMNAILGMTELALDSEMTDDQRQYLNTVKSAAENLLIIINDLLDFAKIEAGKLELDLADFSLRAVVGDTLRSLAVRAHKKGIELIDDVNSNVPDALVGDAGRVRQILLNLVGNAIKFTDQGEIVVRVEIDQAVNALEAEDVALRFSVRDTGIGIPRDQQERVFRAFEQEDSSTTRKYGGTGLGLTIAARLVALMNGQITLESAPGVGSTFSFTAKFGRRSEPPQRPAHRKPGMLRDLPAPLVDDNAANRRQGPEKPATAATRLSILAAEDNELNRLLLEQLLGRRGHRVRLAKDGREALAIAREGEFDLLLLDVHMPEMDGFQVVRALREHERQTGSHLPVIALTARSRKEDREQCLAAGMDDFLAKPIQAADLWAAIDRVVEEQPNVDPSSRQLLSPDVLLAACGGDATILESLGRAFRAGLPDLIAAVQQSLRDGDAVALREAAHKFCGMISTFSTQVGRLASDLEDVAAEGQLEQARPLVAQLETAAERLTQQLRGLSLESLREQTRTAAESRQIGNQ